MTSTTAQTTTYGCPDWCRGVPDHHAVNLDHGRAVVDHDGPRFGPFISTGGMTRAESGELLDVDAVVNDLDNVPLDPEQLRTLAADALAAAAWLEARR